MPKKQVYKTLIKLASILITAALLLSGCKTGKGEPEPTLEPEQTSIAIVSAAPTPSPTQLVQFTADGWYELSQSGDYIMVYLSDEQGVWSVAEGANEGLKVTEQAGLCEGCTAFRIEATGDCATSELIFVCKDEGAAIGQCGITIFVNETWSLEVVEADLPLHETLDDSVVQTPLSYTLDYHRSTQLLCDFVGEHTVEDAKVVIDAFLNWETEAMITPDQDSYLYLNKLMYAVDVMCPPFYALTDFDTMTAYDNGTVSWSYQDGARERLTAFETEVYAMMARIDERDCETAKAMILYNGLTMNSAYDYDYYNKKEVTAEESRLPSSGFTAIACHSGICTAYAEALAFLYTQIGIESVTVNGNAPDSFHEWTLASIDGELYYCDPTFDLGGGFKYFGLSEGDRCSWAGGFDADTIMLFSKAVSKLYSVDSTRFGELHSALSEGFADFRLLHSSQKAEFAGGTYSFDCLG
ncbi:MAG TPA: hypothetical protein PLM48_06860 [Clostridia bacterium]|nr:hypothetical protein [Clostridia bacterium]